MADEVRAKITGLDDVTRALRGLPAKLRRRVLGNVLRAGARVVRDEARARAPVLSAENALRAPYRKPGTVKRAISVRTSKWSTRSGDVGVFVNVRPAKKGQAGAKSTTDPYYWRWLEWGHRVVERTRAGLKQRRGKRRQVGYVSGVGFLTGAAAKLPAALERIKAALGPAVQKLNRPDA